MSFQAPLKGGTSLLTDWPDFGTFHVCMPSGREFRCQICQNPSQEGLVVVDDSVAFLRACAAKLQLGAAWTPRPARNRAMDASQVLHISPFRGGFKEAKRKPPTFARFPYVRHCIFPSVALNITFSSPLYGFGSKLKSYGYAGFSLWFHLPRCHFGSIFLSHSYICVYTYTHTHIYIYIHHLLRPFLLGCLKGKHRDPCHLAFEQKLPFFLNSIIRGSPPHTQEKVRLLEQQEDSLTWGINP